MILAMRKEEHMNRTLIGLIVALVIVAGTAMGWAQTNLTVVRGTDNGLWAMTCDGALICSSWYAIPGRFSSAPTLNWDPAIQKYILTGIGIDGSSIWRSTFNADGTWNDDWTRITGASPSPVAVAGAGFSAGAKSMGLTASGSANLMSVDLGMSVNEGAGAQIRYTIVATNGDGANFAMETGTIMFLAFTFTQYNKGVSCEMSPDKMIKGSSPNAGCVPTFFGGNQGVSITDNLPFTPTVHQVYFEITNLSRSPVRLEP